MTRVRFATNMRMGFCDDCGYLHIEFYDKNDRCFARALLTEAEFEELTKIYCDKPPTMH